MKRALLLISLLCFNLFVSAQTYVIKVSRLTKSNNCEGQWTNICEYFGPGEGLGYRTAGFLYEDYLPHVSVFQRKVDNLYFLGYLNAEDSRATNYELTMERHLIAIRKSNIWNLLKMPESDVELVSIDDLKLIAIKK